MMRLMSGEIKGDQEHDPAVVEEKCRGTSGCIHLQPVPSFCPTRLLPSVNSRLTMTRGDIGNYLGLTVETISRLLGRFQKSGMLAVKGKYITIENNDALAQLAGHTRNVA